MNRRILLTMFLALFLLPGLALAESGAHGRVAWRGELIEGVVVRAYRQIADIALDKTVAVSEPTGLDGTYRLELPPGSYYLTARNYDADPVPGKLFCYYSGSPVQVTTGGYRNVGFNLVRIPEEQSPEKGKRSGLSGELTYQDQPLERAYLYVYKDVSRGFKGPGYFIQPVEKGSFRLNLPPGEYYLLARKRVRGGQFGPIEIGDYFNYYYGNPVTIEEGQRREVKIETITRLSMLEADPAELFRGVRGLIVDGSGRPRSGMRVFAYRSAEMVGTPVFFSGPTDAEGRFELELPYDESFYLLARQQFGGPAEVDELYGKLVDRNGVASPVSLDRNEKLDEVTIHVAPRQEY